MHISTVELASLIIISYAISRFFSEVVDAGRKRRKGLAAKIEFQDNKTLPERKRDLLARYAEHIVSAPAQNYYEAAEKQDKEDRPDLKGELVLGAFYGLGAMIFIGVWELAKMFFSWIR